MSFYNQVIGWVTASLQVPLHKSQLADPQKTLLGWRNLVLPEITFHWCQDQRLIKMITLPAGALANVFETSPLFESSSYFREAVASQLQRLNEKYKQFIKDKNSRLIEKIEDKKGQRNKIKWVSDRLTQKQQTILQKSREVQNQKCAKQKLHTRYEQMNQIFKQKHIVIAREQKIIKSLHDQSEECTIQIERLEDQVFKQKQIVQVTLWWDTTLEAQHCFYKDKLAMKNEAAQEGVCPIKTKIPLAGWTNRIEFKIFYGRKQSSIQIGALFRKNGADDIALKGKKSDLREVSFKKVGLQMSCTKGERVLMVDGESKEVKKQAQVGVMEDVIMYINLRRDPQITFSSKQTKYKTKLQLDPSELTGEVYVFATLKYHRDTVILRSV